MHRTSQQIGATPTGEYSWRAPSPPHIHIPPFPDGAEISLPPVVASAGPVHTKEEILRVITQGQHIRAVKWIGDWKYEYRRQSQPILSFLELGPASAARDIEALKIKGVTMLLVVRNTKTAQALLMSGDKVANQLGIESASIDVDGNPELIAAFPRAIDIINEHLVSIYRQRVAEAKASGEEIKDISQLMGKVLVFCESGNERSAAVVAAYMMKVYDMSLVTAIQFIQSIRFCVAYDDALKHLLLSYQDVLQAQKSIAEVQSAEYRELAFRPTPSGREKRGRKEIVDDDVEMEMDQADDEERFSGRARFVPFHDPDL
ncbi:dual specificity phosphatase-like protein [Xylogone sp. PMI_703]|nr:dual specificity phosphatase-like protein [Xylogone sp. PMI_703]